jgi:CheY-like chemotaxis protein
LNRKGGIRPRPLDLRLPRRRPDPTLEDSAEWGDRPMAMLRILLVEDEVMIGVLLAELLESMGHDVCCIAATEADAVCAAAYWKPDLMIVDVWLAEGDGVSAVAEILRDGPVPHFYVSAGIALVRTLKPDAEVMQKPFRDHDLVQVIGRAIDGAAVN